MRQLFFRVAAALVSGLALHLPVQAAGMPEVSSVLKKMLGALPVTGIKDEVQKMALTLKNTSLMPGTGSAASIFFRTLLTSGMSAACTGTWSASPLTKAAATLKKSCLMGCPGLCADGNSAV